MERCAGTLPERGVREEMDLAAQPVMEKMLCQAG